MSRVIICVNSGNVKFLMFYWFSSSERICAVDVEFAACSTEVKLDVPRYISSSAAVCHDANTLSVQSPEICKK